MREIKVCTWPGPRPSMIERLHGKLRWNRQNSIKFVNGPLAHDWNRPSRDCASTTLGNEILGGTWLGLCCYAHIVC